MLSFSSPSFLWLLPMLAIPVILHLMRRNVTVNITFPTIRFLSVGKIPKKGKFRLRDLLLLLLRLLMLAALIFALAGPELKLESQSVAEIDSRHMLVVFDNTASRSNRVAVDKIEKVFSDLLTENVTIDILSYDNRTKLIASNIADSTTANQVIADLPITNYVGKIKRLFSQLDQLIGAKKYHSVYFLSDFGKNSWPLTEVDKLQTKVDVNFIDISDKTAENSAIVKVEVQTATSGKNNVFVDVMNYSSKDLKRTLLYNEESFNQEKLIELKAGKISTIFFSTPKTNRSQAVISTKEEDDFDSSYYLWTGAKPNLAVLLVANFEGEVDKNAEAFYLMKALNLKVNNSQRNMEFIPAAPLDFAAMEETELKKADAIIILGTIGELDRSAVNKIKKYLQQGGFVFTTPGKTSSNQFFALAKAGILNSKYLGVYEKPLKSDGQYVKSIDKSSSLAKTFAYPNEADFLFTPINKFIKLKTMAPATDLLLSENGYPLLSSQKVGKGVFYSFNFALSTSWSDFPLSSSFVPMLKELFKPEELGAGDAIKKIICSERTFYQEKLNEPKIIMANERPVEVNVSRKESDPTQVSFLELRKAMAIDHARKVQDAVTNRGSEVKKSLKHYFVYALMAFILLEILGSLWADKRGTVK